MKGQVLASIYAVESVLAQGNLPVNIKFLIEGEEEVGSPNLTPFIEAHKDLLDCDVAINPDASMIAADIPTITYGLRGLAYFELDLIGPPTDLHSGLFGGIIHNPAQVLCDLISGMHDSQGRVTLPNFYRNVIPLADEERQELNRLQLNQTYYKIQSGAPTLWGEQGFTEIERISARPTLEVNGIFSGYIGSGSKTVIPSRAMAKISMRLVPDQDPQEVQEQLEEYLRIYAPKSVSWKVIPMAGGPACITNIHHPAVKAASKALESVWRKKPVYKREGGSIPVVADMKKILGADSVLVGFSLPDDHIHGPNEKLHLPTWYKGIDAFIHLLYNLPEEIKGTKK